MRQGIINRAAAGSLAVAAVLMPTAGHAVDTRDFATRTAGQLADLCAAKPVDAKGTAANNFCHGFAQGVVDMKLQQDRAAGKPSFCFPNPAPKREATLDEFVTWVRAQPSRLSAPPTDALFQFLGERFPCAGR